MINFAHTQNLSKKKNKSTPLPGAGFLAPAKGVAKYGAYAMRNNPLGMFTQKSQRPPLPFLCPLTRLLGPHCFRKVAPLCNGFLGPLAGGRPFQVRGIPLLGDFSNRRKTTKNRLFPGGFLNYNFYLAGTVGSCSLRTLSNKLLCVARCKNSSHSCGVISKSSITMYDISWAVSLPNRLFLAYSFSSST